jgi:ubiquinone/menaquinone biosynthesis C-methylase UbiE
MTEWTIDRLDELMAHFDEGYADNFDEAYKRFEQVSLAPPSDLPHDPFSPEYRARYLQLYQTLANRSSYEVENEGCEFDVDQFAIRPFPYFTKSTLLAGKHFSLIGTLLTMMGDLKEGSRILECGFGWGHTTLALAMLGHNVTGLDIEARFCEVVRRRAIDAKVDVELVNSDFLWVETTDQKFDAVCFFESFHHCWEFERLLLALQNIIAPGGKIYFGAEPINEQFTVPWGVRLDGESLLVARRNGWMELGFHSDYFAELLKRTGWFGQCIEPHFWVATRRSEPLVFKGGDVRLHTQVGTKEGDLLRIYAADTAYALYGPYMTLPAGNYRAVIDLDVEPFDGIATMDIAIDGGNVIAAGQFDASQCAAGSVECTFTLGQKAERLEARLVVPGGFKANVRRLSFAPLD